VLPADPDEVERFFRTHEALRPDVVFDVAGRAEAVRTALEVVRPGGRVGLLGYAGSDSVTLPASLFMRKLLHVRGILSPTGTWRQAIELLAGGAIDPAPLLTHKRPLEDFPEALTLLEERRDGAIRVVVNSEATV
jgi:threonine dehydrogenase-like Zn-dependent dehydrogenase